MSERPNGSSASVREISASMSIPASFLRHVMADLVRAGLVTSTTGRAGGYLLARRPDRIDLLDVIEAAEGDGRSRTCVLRDALCGREDHCQVHDAFFLAQEALLSNLRTVTIADIAQPESDESHPRPRV